MDHYNNNNNNNNNDNNNRTFRKVACPLHCFQVELESGMSVFVEGEKPEDLEKTLGGRTGIEPEPQWWEASALTSALFPLPALHSLIQMN